MRHPVPAPKIKNGSNIHPTTQNRVADGADSCYTDQVSLTPAHGAGGVSSTVTQFTKELDALAMDAERHAVHEESVLRDVRFEQIGLNPPTDSHQLMFEVERDRLASIPLARRLLAQAHGNPELKEAFLRWFHQLKENDPESARAFATLLQAGAQTRDHVRNMVTHGFYAYLYEVQGNFDKGAPKLLADKTGVDVSSAVSSMGKVNPKNISASLVNAHARIERAFDENPEFSTATTEIVEQLTFQLARQITDGVARTTDSGGREDLFLWALHEGNSGNNDAQQTQQDNFAVLGRTFFPNGGTVSPYRYGDEGINCITFLAAAVTVITGTEHRVVDGEEFTGETVVSTSTPTANQTPLSPVDASTISRILDGLGGNFAALQLYDDNGVGGLMAKHSALAFKDKKGNWWAMEAYWGGKPVRAIPLANGRTTDTTWAKRAHHDRMWFRAVSLEGVPTQPTNGLTVSNLDERFIIKPAALANRSGSHIPGS